MDEKEARQNFLFRMYDQLFNDINRHIVVVWQCVGVVVGAFAILALAEKKVIPIDAGVTLIVILVGWLFAHLEDAAYWYNRNLAIISNIEKQFLQQSDLRNIHWYWGVHRPDKMLTHLSIQRSLGIGIGVFILGFHFVERVVPGFGLPLSEFNILKALPYAFAVAAALYAWGLRRERAKSYRKFIENSPGLTIDMSGIDTSYGHGQRSD